MVLAGYTNVMIALTCIEIDGDQGFCMWRKQELN